VRALGQGCGGGVSPSEPSPNFTVKIQ
jgi:hypothetical protein